MTPQDLENKLADLINEVNNSQLSEEEILTILQSNTDISEFDLDVYIQNITSYTEERKKIMKEIYDMTRNLETEAEYNIEEYEQQVKLLVLSEQRLRETKLKLQILKDYEINKNRQVNNISYYRKYYRAWSGYMGTFVVVLVVNVLLFYLSYLGWIPSFIPAAIVAVSMFYLYLISWDLRKRDKLIFDEYDWGFDPNNVKLDKYKSSEEPPVAVETSSSSTSTCASVAASSIEESGGTIICPPGYIYNESSFKCVNVTNNDQRLSVIRAMWDASGCPNSELINDSYVEDGGEWSLNSSFSAGAASDMNKICNETVLGTANQETRDKCGVPTVTVCPDIKTILNAGSEALSEPDIEGFENYSNYKTVLIE